VAQRATVHVSGFRQLIYDPTQKRISAHRLKPLQGDSVSFPGSTLKTFELRDMPVKRPIFDKAQTMFRFFFRGHTQY